LQKSDVLFSDMKLDDQFTTPDQRFFFPTNHETEHHSSVDTSKLPGTLIVPGEAHYAVFEKPGDNTLHAHEIASAGRYTIPSGATILRLAGVQHDPSPGGARPRIQQENFDVFDPKCSYTPEARGAHIIVEVDTSRITGPIADERFDDRGVALFRYGDQLPELANRAGYDETRYGLLGIITPNDRLVTWRGENGRNVFMVDVCVVQALKQNRLEEALLYDAVGSLPHLVGALDTTEAAKAYLQYFDHIYRTSYTLTTDERLSSRGSAFPSLTEDQREAFDWLRGVASRCATTPRSALA
jgi:hypothetical protein